MLKLIWLLFESPVTNFHTRDNKLKWIKIFNIYRTFSRPISSDLRLVFTVTCRWSLIDNYLDVSTTLRTGCSLTDSNLIVGRRNCCGARPVVARTDFQSAHWQAAHRTPPVSSVRDLGIFVDSDLVMPTHVCQTVSRCFAALRRSAAQHLSPRLGDRLSVACYCFSTQPAGLR